jgi:hypothetical protein
MSFCLYPRFNNSKNRRGKNKLGVYFFVDKNFTKLLII